MNKGDKVWCKDEGAEGTVLDATGNVVFVLLPGETAGLPFFPHEVERIKEDG